MTGMITTPSSPLRLIMKILTVEYTQTGISKSDNWLNFFFKEKWCIFKVRLIVALCSFFFLFFLIIYLLQCCALSLRWSKTCPSTLRAYNSRGLVYSRFSRSWIRLLIDTREPDTRVRKARWAMWCCCCCESNAYLARQCSTILDYLSTETKQILFDCERYNCFVHNNQQFIFTRKIWVIRNSLSLTRSLLLLSPSDRPLFGKLLSLSVKVKISLISSLLFSNTYIDADYIYFCLCYHFPVPMGHLTILVDPAFEQASQNLP